MLELSTERESKVGLRIEDYMLKVVLTPKAEERSLRSLLLTQLRLTDSGCQTAVESEATWELKIMLWLRTERESKVVESQRLRWN